MRLIFILLSLILIYNLSAGERFLARIDNPEEDILKTIQPTEYDIAGYKPGHFLDLVLTQSEIREIRELGFQCEITKTESDVKNALKGDRDLPGYRDYDTVLMELEIISASYPGLCSLIDLGDTRGKEYADEGNANYDDYIHDVWAIKLSDNVAIEEDEPNLYYFGVHHAREPISAETVLLILYHLLDNYGSDPDITYAIDNSQLWFVPLVNPNGHKIVIDEEDVWWRKNIRDNNENGILDEGNWNGWPDGVDNNRNYSYEWGLVGAADDPLEETFHGPDPLSEPENQAIAGLLDNRHFVAGISYHTHGELVLYPFGYNEGVIAPDRLALDDLAVEIAMNTPSLNGGYYTPQESWELYPLMGGLDDYSYGFHGIFAYTVEMATEFIPPANMVPVISQDNLAGALILMNRIHHSTLTGHITDAVSGDPLVAEIFIEGIDDTGVFKPPHTSDENFGSYYRMLLDGDYTVTFSTFGYEDVTYDDININSEGQTVLDVVMNQAPVTVITGTVYDIDTMEPIASAEVEIQNTPLETAISDDNGEFSISDVPYGIYNIKINAEDYVGMVEEIAVSESSTTFIFLMQFSNAESFENEVFSDIWYFNGSEDWFIDDSEAYDGLFSARSGSISSDQTTSLLCELDVTSHSPLIFYKKVSCEEDSNDNYDYLVFFMDGSEIDRWDGEDDWSEEIINVDPGLHIFEWRYVKDGYVSSGSDCGWIDFITLPLTLEDTVVPDPIAFELEFEADQNFEQILSLYNSGVYDVDFNVTVSDPVSWISTISPESGNLTAEGGSMDITISFDTSGLENGDYSCDLILNLSQVERDAEIIIPVDLTISASGSSEEELPSVTSLSSNYPNPFNPETNIAFNLKEDTEVKIDIINIKGQLIKTLLNEFSSAGSHILIWNGTDSKNRSVSSGLYFYRMQTKDFTKTRKMLLIK